MSAVRFVANLDCETTWTAEVAAARDPGVHVPPPPPRLLARLSALGTLLGALTRPGDRLWTPLPVDPERVRPGPGGTRPIAESGPLAKLADVDRVVAWGETREVAAFRGGTGNGVAVFDALDELRPRDWLQALGAVEPAVPGVAMQANDRALSAAIRTLPGEAWIASPEELVEHVASGGASASPTGRWVLKAPLSAAGRDRLRGSGTHLVAPGDRVRLRRLLQVHGRLRFEPWMKRTADFGACAFADPACIRPAGVHVLDMAGGGALRSVRALGVGDPALSTAERRKLSAAVLAAGCALVEIGYRGPFGVDAFRYLDADGRERFHALSEINARLTFGFVARALADAAGWDPGEGARAASLCMGTGGDLEAAGDDAWPLLLPSDGDPVAAWLAG